MDHRCGLFAFEAGRPFLMERSNSFPIIFAVIDDSAIGLNPLGCLRIDRVAFGEECELSLEGFNGEWRVLKDPVRQVPCESF